MQNTVAVHVDGSCSAKVWVNDLVQHWHIVGETPIFSHNCCFVSVEFLSIVFVDKGFLLASCFWDNW